MVHSYRTIRRMRYGTNFTRSNSQFAGAEFSSAPRLYGFLARCPQTVPWCRPTYLLPCTSNCFRNARLPGSISWSSLARQSRTFWRATNLSTGQVPDRNRYRKNAITSFTALRAGTEPLGLGVPASTCWEPFLQLTQQPVPVGYVHRLQFLKLAQKPSRTSSATSSRCRATWLAPLAICRSASAKWSNSIARSMAKTLGQCWRQPFDPAQVTSDAGRATVGRPVGACYPCVAGYGPGGRAQRKPGPFLISERYSGILWRSSQAGGQPSHISPMMGGFDEHRILPSVLEPSVLPSSKGQCATHYRPKRTQPAVRSNPSGALIASSPSRLSVIQTFWPFISGAGLVDIAADGNHINARSAGGPYPEGARPSGRVRCRNPPSLRPSNARWLDCSDPAPRARDRSRGV
jgi:hypothetical protein